jgi:uncharacterized protein YmfQ (DUF2313 family)
MTGPELQPRTGSDYLAMLQALLPRGIAWTRSPEAGLTKVLHAAADELERVDRSARLLPEEINPATTINALTDWERVLGLPDQCLPAGTSFQERRAAVLAKLTDVGRHDLAFWEDLAVTLGYTVSVEEHWPFVCGWHECGHPQAGWTPGSGMSIETWERVMGYPIGRCGPEEIRYWWNVVVHGDSLLLFRCGGDSLCPELLMDWTSAESLECVMRREKPAHTLLTFEYREV